MTEQLKPQPTPPDFSICKLCGDPSAHPTYLLGATRLYTCPACDFHYLNRLDPVAGDAPVSLTDRQESYIDARLANNAKTVAMRMELVRDFIDLKEKNALDVGTGVGQFLQLLQEGGARGVGIEPSGLRRAFARKQFGLHLHRELIEELPWIEQKSSFDLITLWDVFEHVNDPRATMQGAYNLLKPGGWLFLETDNRDCVSYRLSCLIYYLTRGKATLFLPNFYRPVPYGHKQIFRPTQLYALAEATGFELIATAPRRKERSGGKTLTYRPYGRIIMAAQKPARA